MKKPNLFTAGFFFVFFMFIAVLFVIYSYFYKAGADSSFLIYLYGAIIFLFVLFGVIAISFFYVYRFKKRRKS